MLVQANHRSRTVYQIEASCFSRTTTHTNQFSLQNEPSTAAHSTCSCRPDCPCNDDAKTVKDDVEEAREQSLESTSSDLTVDSSDTFGAPFVRDHVKFDIHRVEAGTL